MCLSILGLGGDFILYRILDRKVIPLRGNSYTDFKLLFMVMLVFGGAIALGGLFASFLAKPLYILFLKPALLSIEKVTQHSSSNMAMAMAIFLKNILAVLLCVLAARRTRGISLALLLIINGLVIGSILCAMYSAGTSPLYLIAGVLPHGILELNGLFIGAALGLKLLLVKEEQLSYCIKEVKFLFAKVVIPMLLLAAFVEAYITPDLMKLFAM